jgi:hypothetical protein
VVECDCGGLGDEKVVMKIEGFRKLGGGGFGRYVAKGFQGSEFGVEVAFGWHGAGYREKLSQSVWKAYLVGSNPTRILAGLLLLAAS